jgi:hypothetical protein
MPIEQMNISLLQPMARFIRSKVIRRSVQRGIKDIEAGRSEEFDADGLRGLGKESVARSVRKHAARATAE